MGSLPWHLWVETAIFNMLVWPYLSHNQTYTKSILPSAPGQLLCLFRSSSGVGQAFPSLSSEVSLWLIAHSTLRTIVKALLSQKRSNILRTSHYYFLVFLAHRKCSININRLYHCDYSLLVKKLKWFWFSFSVSKASSEYFPFSFPFCELPGLSLCY